MHVNETDITDRDNQMVQTDILRKMPFPTHNTVFGKTIHRFHNSISEAKTRDYSKFSCLLTWKFRESY